MNDGRRGLSALLLGTVALAGAGTMTVELAAVRLLAPWFGASAMVWTNVIGVILLALALGYLLGARLSRRGSAVRRMGVTLLVAAAVTALLPGIAAPVAGALVPSGLDLDQAAQLMVWGSLACSLVLFLPAALAMGCVGPLAVEALAQLRGAGAGDAGGRVLGASTLGSLVGTFATTHLFVPRLGLQWTFLGSAAALGLAGLLLLGRRWSPLAVGSALLFGIALCLPAYRPPGGPPGWKTLERRQSGYQWLKVVELPESEGSLRFLQVNESLDSYQSVWQAEKGLLPTGHYYNYFAPPLWWSTREASSEDWQVLILGLGAGTAVRVLEGVLPTGVELATVGVELDPAVTELGERWFQLERNRSERRVLASLDARAALRGLGPDQDQVVLDCYANNMEIPWHLASVEFFEELRRVLREGGWLTVNVGGFGVEDPVVDAVARSAAVGFGSRVLAVRVPFSRNVMLYARRGVEPPSPGSAQWSVASEAIGGLLRPLEIEGATRWFAPGDPGLVLTDDHNPIDLLQMRSIAVGRARLLE